jgi:translation initiation factor IF-2
MAKVRVYELAKELGTTSKKLIDVMESMDIKVNNHMSTLTDDEAKRIMAVLTGQSEEKPPQEPAKAAAAKPEKAAKKEAAKPEKATTVDKKKEKKKPEEQPAPSRKARKALQEEKRAALLKEKRPKMKLEGQISVGELAGRLEVTPAQLIGYLMEIGVMANINQPLTPDTVELVAEEYGYDFEYVEDPVEEELLTVAGDDQKKRSCVNRWLQCLDTLIMVKHLCLMRSATLM